MAGLFYLGRIFVYHREAMDDPDQQAMAIKVGLFEQMETRVYNIIMNPAMVIAWISGLTMIYLYGWDWFKLNIWIHFKIFFLLMLSGYQGYCKKIMVRLKNGESVMDSTKFRLFNEVPTVMMIIIIALAVLKNNTNPIILILTVIAVIGLLIYFTRLYKKIRSHG
jgi:protoporphyrinogen IX oxidase